MSPKLRSSSTSSRGQVVSARILKWLHSLGLGILLHMGIAHASHRSMDAPLVPTLDAIGAAASADQKTNCGSSHCAATEALSRSLDVLLDALATTNGVTRPVPRNRDHLATMALGRALLDHPTLYAPVCGLSRDLASRYGVPGTSGDLFVAVSLLRLATAIDDRKQEQCLPQLLASFPHNEAADIAITNARTLCENQPGHAGDCARLTR